MKKTVFTVLEAVKYQRENCDRVIFSRDALYALARSGEVPVVKSGTRIYFPRRVLEGLLDGTITARGA